MSEFEETEEDRLMLELIRHLMSLPDREPPPAPIELQEQQP